MPYHVEIPINDTEEQINVTMTCAPFSVQITQIYFKQHSVILQVLQVYDLLHGACL